MFKPYIGIQNIVGDSYVLTWAAKWHGDTEITYSSRGMTSRKKMIQQVYKLINEADAVVTFNGDNFDLKILNQEFMELGLSPPAPYKSVDLLKTMKKRFRGTSNKLDYWLKKLSLGAKIKHRGFQLWIDCMNGDKDAFEEMSEYNINDVTELEKLFDRVRGWIPSLPNHSVFSGKLCCPQCGGSHYHRRGSAHTQAGVYPRYHCTNKSCGKWFRGTKSEASTERFISL